MRSIPTGVTLYVDEAGVLNRERGFFDHIGPYQIPYRSSVRAPPSATTCW